MTNQSNVNAKILIERLVSELAYPFYEIVEVPIKTRCQTFQLNRPLLLPLQLKGCHLALIYIIASPVRLTILEPNKVRQGHYISHFLK